MIEDRERRAFLVKLLGVPAALMALEHEAFQTKESSSLLLNDDPMSFLEDVVATRWRTFLIGGPSNAAQGLHRVVQEVTAFERNVRGQAWHQRALTQLCMVYQLQASVTGDMMQYEKALEIYKTAFVTAKELRDLELMAAIRVRQGIVFMREEQPEEAITYLNDGFRLVNRSGYPQLKGNILMILSEAYAKARRSQECWRALGLAESVLEQLAFAQERSYRTCDLASIQAHKGVDALLLNDFDRALRLIEKSLKRHDRTQIPAYARLLARKAETYFGLHRIDACVVTAEEAYLLAASVGASNTITRIKSLYEVLSASSWKREPEVRRLGAVLATK